MVWYRRQSNCYKRAVVYTNGRGKMFFMAIAGAGGSTTGSQSKTNINAGRVGAKYWVNAIPLGLPALMKDNILPVVQSTGG